MLIIFAAMALQTEFSTSIALNILTTSTSESKTAISLYYPYILFALLYFSSLYMVYKHLATKKRSPIFLYAIASFAILFYTYKATRAYQFIQVEKQIGIVATPAYKIGRYLEYGPFQVLSPIYEATQYLATSKNDQNAPYTFPNYTQKEQKIENIIVIIGESAQREALQLYNSSLNTTPYAKQREQQLYIYDQAIAPSAYTNTAIPLMLSDQLPTINFVKTDFSNHVIAIANNTKQWSTYWLSNQERLSRFSNYYTLQAEQAQHKIYTDGLYDEVLIPYLQETITDKNHKRLIFLHLKGSHFNAKDRYPTSFDKTKEYQSFTNEYYNSILYTDYLIEEIIKTVQQTPSIVIYVADHGQSIVNKQFVHSFSKKGVEVPFYIWSSSTLEESLYKTGRNSSPISTTELYSILLNYMGIEGLPPKDKNTSLQVLTPTFSTQPYSTMKEN